MEGYVTIEKPVFDVGSPQNNPDLLSEAWAQMVSCVVHDVTSPLVGIRIAAGAMEEMLPELMEGYLLAARHDLFKPKFPEKQLKGFGEEAISGIKQDITRVLDFLRLLFPFNEALLLGSKDTDSVNASVYLDEVLKKYPFTDQKERNWIRLNDSYTFTFNDVPPFIERLFFHLLDNALSAIRNAGKGELSIWAEAEANYHLIHFKDTARGMDEEALARVFCRFFSKREGKIVPGLGFCRLALLQSGGDVICHSVEGSYTDFVVKFPNLPKNAPSPTSGRC
jgi:two-component system CAI-1 autoinducer sensor kinase/phosphatase CqsS